MQSSLFSSWPLANLQHLSPVVIACVVALAATYAFIVRHRKAAALADLSGRVVVICGASQGIARELALHYARARCRLVLASRNTQLLEELAARCKSLGALDALVFSADFANDDSSEQLAAFVTRQFNCLDVLVLNMIKPFYGPWSSVKTVRRGGGGCGVDDDYECRRVMCGRTSIVITSRHASPRVHPRVVRAPSASTCSLRIVTPPQVKSVREQFDVGAPPPPPLLFLPLSSCLTLTPFPGFFGYLSCFMACQCLLERAAGGGRVLVVSSMASIMCVPLPPSCLI